MTGNHYQHDKETTQAIIKNVAEYGYHLALVEENGYLPNFVYSIGLYKVFNHAELICFGLPTNTMESILNHAGQLIMHGELLIPDKLYAGFLEGYDVQFIKANKEYYRHYVGYAGWFYDMTYDFPLLQLVWPDKQHNFPWQNEFNPDWKFKQPLLDRGTDFKFYEERNLGVYTTRNAFEGSPILYVYHNEDGDWQFHTSLDPDINEGIYVLLEEITKLDPSINELYHLPYGGRASRESIEDDWKWEEQ
jgi:hypothetical protein